jgi:hypothetical protein
MDEQHQKPDDSNAQDDDAQPGHESRFSHG